MTTAANQATLANWMRVQIHVRNGVDASSAARAASRLTSWHAMQPAYARDELKVFAVDFIPEGWAYVEAPKQLIAMARDSYYTLAHDQDFLRASFTRLLEGAGMRRVELSPGAAKARREGGEADQAGDRLAQLDADYRALVARLRTARENDDRRALGEGLRTVRTLSEQVATLQAELDRLSGYDDTVKLMVRQLT